MLGSLDTSKKINWKSHVSPLVFAYNSTRHESTGQSPYMLMFGRNPRLPIDAALGLRENQQEITTNDTPEPSPLPQLYPKPKPRPRKRPAKRTEELGTTQPDSKKNRTKSQNGT
ncbi:Hypothetical predicted protein [Mytilus galloprovincialis]|uniref:Integrase catalytic domain-containing protein n=1 Tax=Mytilus galloprovincialis TaxID=29158 RepID=A0A8B6GI82_MYTGA|nr:Hypothetical predicted protein [Mytilus galloprovincialis]